MAPLTVAAGVALVLFYAAIVAYLVVWLVQGERAAQRRQRESDAFYDDLRRRFIDSLRRAS